MPAPAELIALDLIERLKTTSVDGNAVSQVVRVNRDAKNWAPKHLSIAVSRQLESRLPRLDHEGNPPAKAYQLPWNIHCAVILSDKRHEQGGNDAAVPLDEVIQNEAALAIRAAVENGPTWYRLGAVSFDADWGDTMPFTSTNGTAAGITLVLRTRYRISETNPSEVRA